LRKNAITCECYGVAAMARREGRERRQRSPSAQQEQDDDDYNVNLSPLRTAAPAARWNDERLIIVCQAVINAPASLYRRNANWGKPVPPGINYLNVFNVKLTHTFLARPAHICVVRELGDSGVGSRDWESGRDYFQNKTVF
jgi:hypothetical protein